MRKVMISTAAAAMIAAPAFAYDSGDAPVLNNPIGGIESGHWFDYQTDLLEARQELESDLRRANDQGDAYDARAEYRRELTDALYDYQKEAIEDGLPVGQVLVGDD